MLRILNVFYHRKLRNSRYLGRVGLVALYLIAMTVILPQSEEFKIEYEVGRPWQESDLYAPFDFAIHKTPDSVLIEEQRVVAQARKIFTVDTLQERLAQEAIQRAFTSLAESLSAYQEAGQSSDSLSARQLLRNIELRWEENPEKLIQTLNIAKVEEAAQEIATAVFRKGFIDYEQIDSLGPYIALRLSRSEQRLLPVPRLIKKNTLAAFVKSKSQGLTAEEIDAIEKVLLLSLKPNYIYDEALSKADIAQRQALISPVYGKVRQNKLIIKKGELVDRETDVILQSLLLERSERFGEKSTWNTFVSQLVINFLLTLILLAYLSVNQPRIYFDNVKLGLIFTVFLLTVSAMVIASRLADVAARVNDFIGPDLYLTYIYLAPACIVPIFISNFFGHRVGFVSNLLVSLYGAALVYHGLEYGFVQLIAGTVAVYSLHRLRKREIFFYTLGYIFVAYTIAFISFEFYTKGGFSEINYGNILLLGINVVFTMISYTLVYPFERLFGVTSDLTYLELLDTNHPLLQKLAHKAPGTFQHSLQVANIAEATVKVVGGNVLLTHVGALYHDIGKIVNAEYFIENVSTGENPHEHLSCEESTEMIIGHVQQGVEIAQKYKLPTEIIDFIETHHGSTRVEFFYQQFLRENNCSSPTGEEQFRYQGPLPFSKETAILMISDSIEAASRSLKVYSPDNLRNLVNGIIDTKIKDKQLERSNLTFKDISVIRRIVLKQLLSIYHSRLEYPKEAEPEVEA